MIFKRKDKIIIEQAVLVEKKIYNSHDNANEIKNLYRMRWGTYNVNTAKSNDVKVYALSFMTKKGKLIFYVDNETYYAIKIDSLGMLTRNRERFVSFHIEKIATETDIKNLNW